ncbi:hypothetical protein GGX14DRAFT_555209 [Mycena pura]|uniref:Uncharacterized protein n=1 Tax=Mycena pura TaxID=153505 RepID=A0AAD7E588_9AGAR|nr:hypothetical protein GGX14DRAFT_555209 [Mycena pura]
MSRIPGFYHRLALALSIIYLALAVWTTSLYGFGTLDGLHFMTALSAILSSVLLLRLIPYTTRVDATNALSRVGKHFVFIGTLLCVWLTPAVRTFIVIFSKPSTPMLSQCLTDRFLSVQCIPTGVYFILPLLMFATLLRASWTVYHRAVAVHGEESIPLPPGIPHPANFFPFKTYPPGHEVPLWMLAHIADTERDEKADSERAVALALV